MLPSWAMRSSGTAMLTMTAPREPGTGHVFAALSFLLLLQALLGACWCMGAGCYRQLLLPGVAAAKPHGPTSGPPPLLPNLRSYEGLMRNDVPHNKGVMVLGNGLGGGLQKGARGDRYEGEFSAGFVHGMGQYTSAKGKVYRGEWTSGLKHG